MDGEHSVFSRSGSFGLVAKVWMGGVFSWSGQTHRSPSVRFNQCLSTDSDEFVFYTWFSDHWSMFKHNWNWLLYLSVKLPLLSIHTETAVCVHTSSRIQNLDTLSPLYAPHICTNTYEPHMHKYICTTYAPMITIERQFHYKASNISLFKPNISFLRFWGVCVQAWGGCPSQVTPVDGFIIILDYSGRCV